MDNSYKRLQDVFFYGLYMDEEILKSKGVNPRNQRVGICENYKLRIGKMATLLREKNTKVYGLVYSLTHEEIDSLYKGSGLTEYISEALQIKLENGENIASLCCNLINPPNSDEENRIYYEKLIACMKKYNLPLPKDV